MASFRLLNINDPVPAQHRLATRQDVYNDKQALFQAMPGWEIANLANGSVDGASYGGEVRNETRTDVAHKLAVYDEFASPNDSESGSQRLSFQLFDINEALPPNYRLATTEEVQANRQALFQAMPGWEIANLANGSVDGASYGGEVRDGVRDDVAHKLAVLPGGTSGGPLRFQLFSINDPIPDNYRLATVGEVESNKPALFQAMPSWEIANLADGSVDGASYGGNTRRAQRNDVTHKLAVAV